MAYYDYLPEERKRLGRVAEELHDAYRAGRTTMRWSAERGLEYTGSEANEILRRSREYPYRRFPSS